MKFSEAIAKAEETFDWIRVTEVDYNRDPELWWFDVEGSYQSRSVRGAFAIAPTKQGDYDPYEMDISFSQTDYITLEWDGTQFVQTSRTSRHLRMIRGDGEEAT
ncbi:MAG: hypothetical protein A2Z24_00585 [Candidatus Woykebacteria bacterium RBG_16_44_10]|uniref:Uncharacterized protein n=1 Tax=Candidatus Woykebacteria bacterium RBG_16_44_10 TaxID=1802597 RepID=A0A1G1WDD0_9BACT|nr:MAG: hypothetical protein A2Z24_00585 [Candidatus Woykebacteria bacterium RBG_16_44_10]